MSAVLMIAVGVALTGIGTAAYANAKQIVDAVDGWVIGAMDTIRRVREGARS